MKTYTYLTLMFCAAAFGLVKLIHNWSTNKVLFAASIFVLIITIYGAALQLADEEKWELSWMLFYIIPFGLILFGEAKGITELQNQILSQVGIELIPSVLPGESKDYFDAAQNQYISMAFPLAAKLIANIMGFLFDRK